MSTVVRKNKAEEVIDRYFKNWVRDDQLVRYKELGVLTEEQYNYAVAEKLRLAEEATEKTKKVEETADNSNDVTKDVITETVEEITEEN